MRCENPHTHIHTLEPKNGTGSTLTQKLTILANRRLQSTKNSRAKVAVIYIAVQCVYLLDKLRTLTNKLQNIDFEQPRPHGLFLFTVNRAPGSYSV